jgi:hypothetical protein
LNASTFRKTAIGLTAAAIIGMGAIPASAQQQASAPFTEKQCSDATSIALGLVRQNQKIISKELIESFVQFGKSKCDLNTDWKLMNKTDEDIFGQFRVLLVAMRTAQNNKPAVLAKQ